MYKELYKCKLCGFMFETAIVEEKIEADLKINELKRKDSSRVHYCEDGNIGIAEILGYKISSN